MRIMRILVVVLMLASVGVATAAPVRGEAPPDLLGVDSDKHEIRVSDFQGKVVVLTFWASWCGQCLKELPILENVQRKLGPDLIAIVAINSDKERSQYLAMRRACAILR